MTEDLHAFHVPGENPETCADCEEYLDAQEDADLSALDDLPLWSSEYAYRTGSEDNDGPVSVDR